MSDMGRDLTAQDVRDALRSAGIMPLGSDVGGIAERLSRIARPSGGVGQPTPIQRVQNQIDDLTRERDLYKRMLERYEPDPTYSTPTELDRLRARVAELEAAGDRLAGVANQISTDINDQFEFLSEILDDQVHEWRTVILRGQR